MQMFYQIKQTDGLWNSTDPISWRDYAGTQDNIMAIPDGTITKTNIPNVNKDNVKYYPFKVSQYSPSLFLYDKATSTWNSVNINASNVIETTKGIRFVTMLSSANATKTYVCLDDTEYNSIPNLAGKMRVETYVSDDITKETFQNYRAWDHSGNHTSPNFIPLAVIALRQDSPSSRYILPIGVELRANESGTQDLVFNLPQLKAGYETDPETENKLLPTIQCQCYAANVSPNPIQSLDSRVTSLENQVLQLQSLVTNVTSDMIALEERVNKILSKVSTVFVSR